MSRRSLNKKENSSFNGIWAKHARTVGKKAGARRKRKSFRRLIQKELTDSQSSLPVN